MRPVDCEPLDPSEADLLGAFDTVKPVKFEASS